MTLKNLSVAVLLFGFPNLAYCQLNIKKIDTIVGQKAHTAWSTTVKDIAPIVAVGLTLILFIIQIRLKRKDDKLALQLVRINNQLSNLYGPLYVSYALGAYNYQAAKKANLVFSFTNADYILWLNEVFMKTNKRIERIINANADLFVGDVPRHCLIFSHHLATLKTCIADLQNEKVTMLTLDERMSKALHPHNEMQSYTIAAFLVLKERQTELLSKSRVLIDEKQLYRNIEDRRLKIVELLNRHEYKYLGIPSWA